MVSQSRSHPKQKFLFWFVEYQRAFLSHHLETGRWGGESPHLKTTILQHLAHWSPPQIDVCPIWWIKVCVLNKYKEKINPENWKNLQNHKVLLSDFVVSCYPERAQQDMGRAGADSGCWPTILLTPVGLKTLRTQVMCQLGDLKLNAIQVWPVFFTYNLCSYGILWFSIVLHPAQPWAKPLP